MLIKTPYLLNKTLNRGYLFCLILNNWGCLTSPTMSQSIGPLQKKKVQTMEAPPNRRFYGRMECLPIWPKYTAEKGRTLGKTYGIKERCYWEHPLGNTLGTHWELDRNMLGTNKKEKKSSPPHPTTNYYESK